MRHPTRQNIILTQLIHLSQEYSFTPPSQAISKYKDIDKQQIKYIQKSNSSFHRLHMSNVHSLRMIKMAQLHLRLADQLIKKRHPDIKIKLKTVTKIDYLSGKEILAGTILRIPPRK